MKTTLIIDDQVLRRAKQEAARRGITLSQLVEGAVRLHITRLRSEAKLDALEPLPVFDGGGALVDVSDRDALYRAMESE